MSAEFPLSDDARHVDAFLRKIADHRDSELQQIAAQVTEEVNRIRRQAYADARNLARRVSATTRERERRQHDRYLYKLRSQLTRDRWSVLEEIRERVAADVWRRFEASWADTEQQWQWCRFWIEAATTLAATAEVRVLCGAGTAEEVAERIRRSLSNHPGRGDIRIDSAAPPGIVIEWQDHQLDGTLAQQCEVVVAMVLGRVAEILDGRQPIEGPVNLGRPNTNPMPVQCRI